MGRGMTGQRWLRIGLLALVVVTAFALGQLRTVRASVEFDLRTIGESVYEARAKIGRVPRQLADLEGTEYLNLPYRKTMLEEQRYVIVRHDRLDARPEANRHLILAYDNTTILSRFGRVWVCRGDLRIETAHRAELARLPRIE